MVHAAVALTVGRSGNYRKLLLELLYGEVEFNPEKDSKDLRKAMKGWGASLSGDAERLTIA